MIVVMEKGATPEQIKHMAERVESMVLHVLDAFGVNRLEGKTHTLKKRKCPTSVEVTDVGQVPAEFKRVTVTLPVVQWRSPKEATRRTPLSTFCKQDREIG